MSPPPSPQHAHQAPVCFYRSGDAMRSRSVGPVVLSGHVAVPAPSARLVADWQRDTADRLDLAPGDVEPLSLARARMRWPDYLQCVQAISDWLRGFDLHQMLATSDVALMACRGAKYHHDGELYGGMAFCNLFLSEDKGLDLHFPASGQRIPLVRGTVVVFDTAQPHAVIARNSSNFAVSDFASDKDSTQVFLTWELPMEEPSMALALQVQFDVEPASALLLDEEQIRVNDTATTLCPATGVWCQAEQTPHRKQGT